MLSILRQLQGKNRQVRSWYLRYMRPANSPFYGELAGVDFMTQECPVSSQIHKHMTSRMEGVYTRREGQLSRLHLA